MAEKFNHNLNYGRSLSLEDFANFTKTLEDVVFPKCQVKLSPSRFLLPRFELSQFTVLVDLFALVPSYLYAFSL
jgi:hypothetical protein